MANWKTDLPIQGTHKYDGYGYRRTQGGVVEQYPCKWDIVPPPQAPTPYILPANSSLEDRTPVSKSTANIKIRWQWIGQGPAPSKVWVRKFAVAKAWYAPSGSATVDNGLGSTTTTDTEANITIKKSIGNKLVEVSTEGGILEVPFALSAESESSNPHPSHDNFCDSSVGYGITLKGSKAIHAQTSYREENGQRVVNTGNDSRADIASYRFIGGIQASGYNYMASTSLTRQLFGLWLEPFHVWQGHRTDRNETQQDTWNYEATIVEFQNSILASELQSVMASHGKPQKVTLKLKDTDPSEDPVQQVSEITVYTHLPHMRPWVSNRWTETGFLHTRWVAIVEQDAELLNGTLSGVSQRREYTAELFGFAGDILGGFQNPYAAAIGALLSVGERLAPKDQQHSVTFTEGLFNDPDAKHDPAKGNIHQALFHKFDVLEKWTWTKNNCYSYNNEGYAGIQSEDAHELNSQKYRGYFKYIGSSGGDNVGGGSGN